MNFNKNKQKDENIKFINNELEKDDLNIKSHLNTSLELSGINVSEDLINRTLEAIKKQEAYVPETGVQQTVEQETSSKKKTIATKAIPWMKYTRMIAGTAAAILVVTVGYHWISSVGLGSKSDSMDSVVSEESSVDNLETSDATAAQKTDGNSSDAAEDRVLPKTAVTGVQEYAMTDSSNGVDNQENIEGNKEENKTTQDTSSIASDDNTNKSDSGGTDNAGESDSLGNPPTVTMIAGTEKSFAKSDDISATDISEAATDLEEGAVSSSLQGIASATGKVGVLSFRDIFLADPEDALSIKITDITNTTALLLTNQEDILNFYTVMDQQQYDTGSKVPKVVNYKIEVTSILTQEVVYTMSIGDNSVVIYASEDMMNENIYQVEDGTLLIKSLEEFYQQYNQ